MERIFGTQSNLFAIVRTNNNNFVSSLDETTNNWYWLSMLVIVLTKAMILPWTCLSMGKQKVFLCFPCVRIISSIFIIIARKGCTLQAILSLCKQLKLVAKLICLIQSIQLKQFSWASCSRSIEKLLYNPLFAWRQLKRRNLLATCDLQLTICYVKRLSLCICAWHFVH